MLAPVIFVRLLVGAVLLLTAAGCSTVGDRERTATDVAVRLLTVVDAGDGEAACALLAPGLVEKLAVIRPPVQAILDKDLPRPGTVLETSVYGQWAQVKLDDDTVFLGAFPGGWRVVAAGCTPQASRPYDCSVEGD